MLSRYAGRIAYILLSFPEADAQWEIKLVSDPRTAHMAADSFLMLGILANYHKYEARNAMLVRFEDLVDEGTMKRVREAASISLLQARECVVPLVQSEVLV